MQGAAAATERPKKEVAEAQKHTMEFGMTQVIEGSRQGDVAVRVVKAVAYMQVRTANEQKRLVLVAVVEGMSPGRNSDPTARAHERHHGYFT